MNQNSSALIGALHYLGERLPHCADEFNIPQNLLVIVHNGAEGWMEQDDIAWSQLAQFCGSLRCRQLTELKGLGFDAYNAVVQQFEFVFMRLTDLSEEMYREHCRMTAVSKIEN